jgi:hypothetical protein
MLGATARNPRRITFLARGLPLYIAFIVAAVLLGRLAAPLGVVLYVYHLPENRLQLEGSRPLRARPLLSSSTLLRRPLSEPARGQDVPSLEAGSEDKGTARRERLCAGAFPGEAQREGMHWSTYEQLFWEHHEVEMEQLVGMGEWLNRLERKMS